MKPLRLSVATAAACICVTGAQAASFTIQQIFTSEQVGNTEVKYAPKVGETYRIAITYTQSGVTAPYDIQFNIGGYKPTQNSVQVYPTVHVTDLTPGTKTVASWAPGDLDDSVPVTVTIGPGKVDAKSVSMTFKPTPPDAILDFYNGHEVTGTQTSEYTVNKNGLPYNFSFLTSIPCTDGWQKLLSNKTTVTLSPGKTYSLEQVNNEGPWVMPMDFYAGKGLSATKLTFVQNFTLQLSSQRVNPDKMRTISWADIDAVQGINVFKYFTQPEAVIESNGPVITQWVNGILGPNYRAHYTPYDAARKLFIAVAARCRYTFPENGKPDLRAKTAAAMCQTGLGDCGSYAMFLTAVWRNIGIPARSCVGAWIGTDCGHCWAEAWFPHAGWTVGDACANSCNTDHRTAFWFGAVSDLAYRYAQERGNTFAYGGVSAEWLQSPMWPMLVPSLTLNPTSGSTVIANYTPPPSMPHMSANVVQGTLAKFDAKTIAIIRKP